MQTSMLTLSVKGCQPVTILQTVCTGFGKLHSLILNQATTEKSSLNYLLASHFWLERPKRSMAVVVVQFLVRKFVDSLVEEEAAAELPFSAHFYDMRAELEKAAISSTNADELRECLYELNDLLAQCRMLTKRPNPRSCFSPSDAWLSNKAKKRVVAIKHRVLQCVQSDSDDSAAALQQDSTAAGFGRWTTSWPEQSRIHGFDQQLAELESVAFGDCSPGRLSGVGIVGMGGIGKTVLAQLLFNSPRARGRFFPRIWVCLTRTACVGVDVRKEVLQSMLMALGLEEEVILSMDGSNSLGELVFAVHEQLKEKRYLVVFDDVWNVDGWYADVAGRQNALPRDDQWSERLAFGLPKERGGVVVVTSRLKQAAETMVGTNSLHRVRPLADSESCWAIFMDALCKQRRPADLATVNGMKEDILETCGGLPSAAKTMGDIFARSLSSPASNSTSQELSMSGSSFPGSNGSVN